MNGSCEEGRVLRKGGLQPGQALILTKALGTGVIFAADMRGRAKGRWVAGAPSDAIPARSTRHCCSGE